jgi:MFS family permease
MGTDLDLQIGDRYTIVLVLFFPTYFLLELPSNIVLRKVGSANWLAFIAVSWGAVMIGQGFVESWISLAICRVLLGAFEAGFFPGCVYLITCWYRRYETQKRYATLINPYYGSSSLQDTQTWWLLSLLSRYWWPCKYPCIRPHADGRRRWYSRLEMVIYTLYELYARYVLTSHTQI